MAKQTAWFLAGLVLLVVLAEYAPKLAGMLLLLLIVYLGLKVSSQVSGI